MTSRRFWIPVFVVLALTPLFFWPGPQKPSVLLITIDTLRADHLSMYGYDRDTTPNLSRLAETAAVYEDAFSVLPETSPAFASMLTGRWPAELGIRGNTWPLGEDATTLAEVLSAADYQTAGFVSGFPLTRKFSGLHQGFDLFDDTMTDPRGGTPNVQRLARKTTDAALAWFGGLDDRPFFLWAHYYDPHGDYNPGPELGRTWIGESTGPEVPLDKMPAYQRFEGITDAATYIALYDAEILKTDAQVGRLLDALAQTGRFDDTLIIVTADHGESLTEHDYWFDHGNEVYAQSLHIPLILNGPGINKGRRVSGIATTPDVFATVLDAADLPSDTRAQSLIQSTGGLPLPRREALSEARFAKARALTKHSNTTPKMAVRDERWTAILRSEGEVVELYDREVDPAEAKDLAPGKPELADELRTRMKAAMRATEGGREPHPVFNESVLAKLP